MTMCMATAAAMLIIGAASAASEARMVDANASLGQISALDGYATWSKPTKGRYRLVIRHAGRIRDAGIPTRSEPFDVSLGKDARGRLVATYSRCRSKGSSNCQLWMMDVRSRRERRLNLRASSTIRSRFSPVLRGRRVVYKAVVGTGSRARVTVYTELLGSVGRPRRLPGGSRGLEAGPDDLAFDGRRVAYTWQLSEAPCANDELFGDSTELWIDDSRGAGHRLARRGGCPGDAAHTLDGVQLLGNRLYFIETLNDRQGTTRIGRYDLRTKQLTFAPAPIGLIVRVVAQTDGYHLLQRRTQGKAMISQQKLTFRP